MPKVGRRRGRRGRSRGAPPPCCFPGGSSAAPPLRHAEPPAAVPLLAELALAAAGRVLLVGQLIATCIRAAILIVQLLGDLIHTLYYTPNGYEKKG